MTQLSSRPPFNDDMEAFVYEDGLRVDFPLLDDAAHGRCTHQPRPEFNRPQTNPTNLVLADLRDYWKHHGTKLTAYHAAAYLTICDYEAMDVPAEHIDHARKVLTRLDAIAKTEAAA